MVEKSLIKQQPHLFITSKDRGKNLLGSSSNFKSATDMESEMQKHPVQRDVMISKIK